MTMGDNSRDETEEQANSSSSSSSTTSSSGRPVVSLTQEAAGGLAAGILGTLIGYPLDLIKTRLQTASESSKATTVGSPAAPQRGIWATGRWIVRTQGVAGLYQGVGPPLVSLTFLNTTNFAAYSYLRWQLGGGNGWNARNALAGAGCGVASGLVSTVENLVKTQLQVANVFGGSDSNSTPRRRYQGSWDCVRTLVREHGVWSLYHGHGINTAREIVFVSTYFFTYEGLRHELLTLAHGSNDTTKTTTTAAGWAIPVAGGCAGAVSWTVSFPLDCIRAGVQGHDFFAKSSPQMSSSWRGVLRHLMATKGFWGLYAGVTPSIIRAFLVSGSRFSAYEFALWLLRGGR